MNAAIVPKAAPTLAAAVLLAAGTASGALPCDADLDGDSVVSITDLFELFGNWGPNPGHPADIDGDGVVGITDMFDLLASWGPFLLDYGPPFPNPEAEQIGLEMLGPQGPLLLTMETFLRIRADLNVIRQFEASLVGETHSPAWVPDQLLVGLVQGAPLDEYLCLNEVYQVTNIQVISQNLYLLTYAGNINVEALAVIYSGAPEVSFAEPNGIIGGQNFWVPTPLGGGVWRWEVDDGWCDCFDGCDCHRSWVFETDGLGGVRLISVQEAGFPWCDFANDTC